MKIEGMEDNAEKRDGKVYVGVDVGSVSVKVALVGDKGFQGLFKQLCSGGRFFSNPGYEYKGILASKHLMVSHYRRIQGEPVNVTSELFGELLKYIPEEIIGGWRITGSGGKCISDQLNIKYENDFFAIARGVGTLYPEVKTILEMGGDNSRYLKITADGPCKAVRILDYETNGDCAAGTGSFMDQQASRLLYDISDVGDIVSGVERSATIAGRCSVFAKSDMIHAQQKGFLPAEVLKGLCEAVVRNFKGTIIKGKKILPRVVFIGGVASNKGVVEAIRTLLNLTDKNLFVPEYFAWMGAIGSALGALESGEKNETPESVTFHIPFDSSKNNFPTVEPLSMDKVVLLRHMVKPWTFENKPVKIGAYLGIDIGSVSTNFALIDEEGNVIKEIYARTNARPIEAVKRGLAEIDEELGNRIHILGAGTTGSGRELIGELIGADIVIDEITAHKTGSVQISQDILHKKVDTIFDIGGQDSKFISVEDGIVVDYNMNNACAAGTGSFLEEQGDKLGISIKDEFARMALQSKRPLHLGERCTVFMERDVQFYLLKGASREDIAAGLAYSVAINYLNRVVQDRKMGEVIYFQGGTAYNDAVTAAFSTLLGKEIIVPPYNGVIGAVGAAFLVRDKITQSHRNTTFRGLNVNAVNYSIQQFTCKGCANYCNINKFSVEGETTYWGDKCTDRFRTKTRSSRKPVIDDLMKLRKQLLLKGYKENTNDGPRIGMPRIMYFHDRFPFWNAFFSQLGFQVVLSRETDLQIINYGADASLAEPCFPISVAHGHVKNILEKDVDFIFLPNQFNAETDLPQIQSMYCPWNQTLPFVIGNHPVFRAYKEHILSPTIHFRFGIKRVARDLGTLASQLGIAKAKIRRAAEMAYKVQQEFGRQLREAGKAALERLIEYNDLAIVLLGRPYNLYDGAVNLNVPDKLRTLYGVNVIPLEFLPLRFLEIGDINENMYWIYGRRIIQAAKWIGQTSKPELHIIYITNFKCGPDSYVKHYIRQASKKPFLLLQFDGHSNDAGIITRCEAYMRSKGILK